MSVKRFIGANSREAMRLVRAVLGDDALILSNRKVDEGVEILAAADGAETGQAATDKARSSEPISATRPTPAGQPWQSPSQAARAAFDLPSLGGGRGGSTDSGPMSAMSERLLREMHEMRELLSRERQQRSGSSGVERQLHDLMIGAGFAATLAEDVLAAFPPELAQSSAHQGLALDWLQRQLRSRLRMLESEDEFLDSGGVIALVGPTGIGKTTTTAKLAARFVMKYGPEQVALVSTDSYRVGAHEQLRIYARLLGVPMYALDIDQSVAELGEELQGRRFIIIDTVGTSQRDQRAVEQIARLQQGPEAVRLVLLLNAASQPETLREVITVYQAAARAAGAPLQDCIITKVDESHQLGPCLDAIVANNLRVLFVSQGQRVPEDLAAGFDTPLIETALAAASTVTPVAAAASAPSNQWSRQVLSQARRVPRILDSLRRHQPAFSELEAAWRLAQLPASLQAEQFDRWHAEASWDRLPATGVLWQRRGAASGVDWSMPDLLLAQHGGWLVLPLLQHRQPAGQAERFEWARTRLQADEHLLNALPDAAGWEWLAAGQRPWMVAARGAQKVFHCSIRQTLAQLSRQAQAVVREATVYKGRAAQWSLSRLAVTAAPTGRRAASQSYPVTAWFAEWRAEDTGAPLAQRYWLTMAMTEQRVAEWVQVQLQAETLPALTRKAYQSLRSLLEGEVSSELLLLLAAGMAATAVNLELAQGEEAMELRADLLSLLGGRQRGSAAKLLQALLCLATIRDGLRRMDSVDFNGVA